jgi:hypothetical protein
VDLGTLKVDLKVLLRSTKVNLHSMSTQVYLMMARQALWDRKMAREYRRGFLPSPAPSHRRDPAVQPRRH